MQLRWSSRRAMSKRGRPRVGPATRHGFNLLEVLIAMFVLTIGMLGVAAAVSMGNFLAVRALIADRAAAVGRNALAEVRAREMLDPRGWTAPDGTPVLPINDLDAPLPLGDAPGGKAGEAFCIDPLYIAWTLQANGLQPHLDRFPFYDPNTMLTMSRVTLNWAPPDSADYFGRLFRAEDDLLFENAALSRPRMLFRAAGVNAVPLPAMAWESPPGPPLRADCQGLYSWMVTVVPMAAPGVPARNQKYAVSVVVFRNRDMTWRDDPTAEAPAERAATVNFLGQGIGGGDVRLSFNPQAGQDGFAALDVAEGQWLLLGGMLPSNPPDPPRKVFVWYRVLSAGETYGPATHPHPFGGDSARYYRELTLAGPDWNLNWNAPGGTDSDGDGILLEAQAVILPNVYGVYTETVEPDRSAPWSFRRQ
ncbi:MAG: prepilin-type N-terminal cleavage/methylation domain-containing protein [Thermogutta sp.]|nr:prepilin-type N-terminal cleavage/methylation domain-containing protein [Thermogutta sp.]